MMLLVLVTGSKMGLCCCCCTTGARTSAASEQKGPQSSGPPRTFLGRTASGPLNQKWPCQRNAPQLGLFGINTSVSVTG